MQRRQAIPAAIAASVLLAGGLTTGIYVNGQEAAAAAAAESEFRAQGLAQQKAAIVAASHAEVLADAGEAVTHARAVLDESAGTVDEPLRADLATAVETLEAARAGEDYAAALAAMPAVRDAMQRVEDAISARRITAQRSAEDAQAIDAAAQEAARAAAEQEASRAAAQQATTRAPAETQATSTRNPGPPATTKQAPTAPVTASPSPPAPAPAGPAPSPRPVVQTISGTLHVRQKINADLTNGCGGYGRFAEFQTGALVAVADGQGNQVGTGQLSGCEWLDAGSMWNMPGQPDYQYYDAVLTYAVPVTEGAGSYTIRIGWKVWDPIAEADLRANTWMADLTVE